MKGFTNVTMLVPKDGERVKGSYVDLNIIVRRRNATGSFPNMKDLEASITPRNIYLIMDEQQGSTRSDQQDPNKLEGSSLPQFLRGLCSSPLPSSSSTDPFTVYYGGKLKLNPERIDEQTIPNVIERLSLIQQNIAMENNVQEWLEW